MADPRFVEGIVRFGVSVAASQPSLGGLVDVLREEQGRLTEANARAGGARATIERIAAELARIGEETERVCQGVAGLAQRAHHIGQVLDVIRDISEQTQILALNATIEAARAGESGRGFAIVAGEVRVLARRTRGATAEIEQLVEAVVREVESATDGIGSLRLAAGALAAEGRDASESVEVVQRVGEAIDSALSRAALRGFVELAKVDHLVYKCEVHKVLMGRSARPTAEFADDHQCRLGRWYHEGEGRRWFSRADGYAALDAPHHRVHQHGREAVAAAHAGAPDAALDAALRMEEASVEVLACLDRMAASARGP